MRHQPAQATPQTHRVAQVHFFTLCESSPRGYWGAQVEQVISLFYLER